jgi:hypothetical protein
VLEYRLPRLLAATAIAARSALQTMEPIVRNALAARDAHFAWNEELFRRPGPAIMRIWPLLGRRMPPCKICCLPLTGDMSRILTTIAREDAASYVGKTVGKRPEGHLQNCIPVFHTDGTPVKLLVRDWEGIRVYRPRLQSAGFDPAPFHPKSRILVDDLNSARNKMFYSVIQNHLGELIVNLVQWAGVAEEELWQIVRNAANSVFDLLEQDPAARKEAEEDRAFFFREYADYKAIMWMRMKGEAHQYMYAKVPNPLAAQTT